MGPIYSLDDFIDMTRRRLPVIALVIFLGSLLALVFAWSQQHIYRASEVMQLERPTIARDLAPSTVEGSSARRLQLIEQQLMARAALTEIIAKYDLFAENSALKDSEKVALLRQSITITGVAAAREGFADDGTISVLTISAELPSPEQARDVAHEFAERTRMLTAAQRTEQTRETLAFFQRQEQALIDEIATLETEIAAYRKENQLSITGDVDFNRTEIARINTALLEIERDKISAELEREGIDTSLRQITVNRQLAEIAGRIASLNGQARVLEERRTRLNERIGASPEIERTLSDFDRQMDQLQTQLDVVSTRRSEAEVGYKLESSEQGERLVTIEEAQLPDYPITPSRTKKGLMGLGFSVVAAFVLAFLLELRHPVIRSAQQMKRETGIMPVVSIPLLDLPRTTPNWRERFAIWRAERADRRPKPPRPDGTARRGVGVFLRRWRQGR